MVTITGKQYIAGDIVQSGDSTFANQNPRTRQDGDYIFYNATPDDIDLAVKHAQDAYQQTRNMSASQLATFLDTVADEIEALGEDLLTIADSETALGIPRLTGERGRTTGQLRAFANLLREGSYVNAIIDTAQPDRQPNPRVDIRQMQFPLGAVAVFSASNFPFAFAVAGGDTASAWAAGCPVIVKGHPGHPATSELFAQAIHSAVEKTEMPKGMFSLIQGTTIEVGQNLVKHKGIAAVGFTGSLRGGRAIFDTASQRPTPIPVYAEMGSINPMVILPNALSERAEALADGLVNSVTLGAGQFCTNPGLILMLKGESTDAFIATVKEKMVEKPEAVLLNKQIEAGLVKAVDQTVANDAVTLLTGGDVLSIGDGYCYRNTVMETSAEAVRDDESLQIEHFGPVTLFVIANDIDDLQATLKVLEGNLTATIHATDDEHETALPIANILREKVGRLIWNGFPTGVEVVYSMLHGGPYPATTAPATTSVGMTAIHRFMRPVAYQNMPSSLLPETLRDDNPLNIMRIVDGVHTRDAVE